MRAAVLVVVCLVAIPVGASAQAQGDPYDQGAISPEAARLHTIVMGAVDAGDMFPDTTATEALGRLYLEGRGGVPHDTLLGCALIEWAHVAMLSQTRPVPAPVADRIAQARNDTCLGLSPDHRQRVIRMTGCPIFAAASETYNVGGDHWVEIDRHGIAVTYRGRQHVEDGLGMCGAHFALARYTRVEPPPAAALAPRHLIERFVWIPDSRTGQRFLNWELWEIVDGSVQGLAGAELLREPGLAWAAGRPAAGLADVSFRMQRDGGIAWDIRDTESAGTIEPLPRPSPSDLVPLPATGSAFATITVVDAFGGAVANARVTLNGVVTRQARTSEAGLAAFENLPDGRYDISAAADGLAPSPRLVIDLAAAGGTPLVIRLKPYAPGPRGSVIRCGIADPMRSLDEYVRGTDLVLHVQVEDQHAYEEVERVPPGHTRTPRTEIRTSSRARVIQAFQGASDALVAIDQRGGSIDHGAYVDRYAVSPDDLLNVGDEYVLFLNEGPRGLVIRGGREGHFRIRNGRVEPAGASPAAREWHGRSAEALFRTLHLSR